MKQIVIHSLIAATVIFFIHGCSASRPVGEHHLGIRSAGKLVTASKDRIVLRLPDGERTFRITQNTDVLVPLETLRPGDVVNVLTTTEDQETALEVKGGPLMFKLDVDSHKLQPAN